MEKIKINHFQNALYKIGNTGVQSKWKIGDMYYKADTNGYEGLAETLASDIMNKSNIGRHFDYEPVLLSVNGKTMAGCASKNGLNNGEELLTVYDTLKSMDSEYIKFIENPYNYSPPGEKIQMFLEEMKDRTGLEDFNMQMTKMMEFDAIILNEDRHYNNIAIIRKSTETGKEFERMPAHSRAFSRELAGKPALRAYFFCFLLFLT